jgi:hypothetical protein
MIEGIFSRDHVAPIVNSVLQDVGVVEFKRLLTHGGIMKARDIFLV